VSNRIKFIIYALIDPRTKEIRYVGKSCYGLGRPRRHAINARSEPTRKAAWILELLAVGLMYEIRVLEHCRSHDDVADAEERWIFTGNRLRWPLTNQAPSHMGKRKHSAETRAKMSASARGKPKPHLLGKPRPDLTEINRRGKSKETIAKITASLIGNKRGAGHRLTEAHRNKIAATRKQEWGPDGWRRLDSPDGKRRNKP
jgi:hypothetical protein